MNISHQIKVYHETHGKLLQENFVDVDQFRIFVKLVDACFAHQSPLEFYNGDTFFVRIPYKILDECIITTSFESVDVPLTELIKSKIEAMHTVAVDGPPSVKEVKRTRRKTT